VTFVVLWLMVLAGAHGARYNCVQLLAMTGFAAALALAAPVAVMALQAPLASPMRGVSLAHPALAAALAPAAQKNEKDAPPDPKRPKLTLKAQPLIAMSPARVVLTAELVGGPDDYEDYYCPTVEWDWGDGTQSASTSDCAPYEPGKSEIKRRFTVEHVFRAGTFRVSFRLKRRDRAVALAIVNIQIRPGLRDTGQ
jgi:hypothetical protein